MGEQRTRFARQDDDTGVASQGPTGEAALSNLDEAVELAKGAQEDDTAAEPYAPWFDSSRTVSRDVAGEDDRNGP